MTESTLAHHGMLTSQAIGDVTIIATRVHMNVGLANHKLRSYMSPKEEVHWHIICDRMAMTQDQHDRSIFEQMLCRGVS